MRAAAAAAILLLFCFFQKAKKKREIKLGGFFFLNSWFDSPMSTRLRLFAASMLCLLSTFALTESRIFGGAAFASNTQVEVTCWGDVLGFDGNLWIMGRGGLHFNLGLAPDPTSVLMFQGDGEENVSFFFFFL
jgi:hypothetical protein